MAVATAKVVPPVAPPVVELKLELTLQEAADLFKFSGQIAGRPESHPVRRVVDAIYYAIDDIHHKGAVDLPAPLKNYRYIDLSAIEA